MRIYSKQGRFYGEIIEVNVEVIIAQNHTGRLALSAFEAFAADKTQVLPSGSALYFASFEAAKAALITWGEDMEQREADAANQDYNDSW